ncbi:MAG: hypothetical protein K1X88_04995 [Nannocystaceae bacterium]|nr:hypothetical protein [Nannocystaceae bacterium]
MTLLARFRFALPLCSIACSGHLEVLDHPAPDSPPAAVAGPVVPQVPVVARLPDAPVHSCHDALAAATPRHWTGACQDIFILPSAAIRYDAASWPRGRWDLAVTLPDGSTRACAFEVRRNDDAGPAEVVRDECTEELGLLGHAPDAVRMRVRHDGVLVAEGEVHFDYAAVDFEGPCQTQCIGSYELEPPPHG